MALQTHTIRQQYLHIELQGSEAQGIDLQQSLARYCQTWLTPVLEQVLTKYAPVDSHWLIEHLEVNVGSLPLQRLQQDLPNLLAQALEKTLQSQYLVKTGMPNTIHSSNIQQQSTPQHLDEALIYFLKTGALPWNLQLPKDKNLEQILLDTWQNYPLHHDPTSIIAALTSATVRTRLIQQFSATFLNHFLKRIAPDLNKRVNIIEQRLQNSELPETISLAFTQQLWATAFAQIALKQSDTDKEIVLNSWQNLPPDIRQQPLLLKILAQHWQIPTDEISAVTKSDKIEFAQPFENEKLLDDEQTNLQNANTIQNKHTAQTLKTAKQQTHSNNRFFDTESPNQHLDVSAGIYIDNAGLVLLHPFLPQFFQALNIADENQLIQAERALCLLHFLTTGQLSAPEYELVLPKLLCNIPLEAPVASNILLTDSEIEEAIALLEAVIRHWEVLKNTGIDGLRGTFLLRAGKITLLDDGDWRLQIENKAFDILLDQLPWGISMIKLPWMQRMLWVEWN